MKTLEALGFIELAVSVSKQGDAPGVRHLMAEQLCLAIMALGQDDMLNVQMDEEGNISARTFENLRIRRS